jgi:branched-chain amino acid transport system ATP-binding protein
MQDGEQPNANSGREMTLLKVDRLHAGYGAIEVLRGISLTVNAAEVVAVLGPNGAGKSTLLRAIAGIVPVRSGELFFDDQSLCQLPAYGIPHKGLVLVPEARHVFSGLSVEENLMVGGTPLPNRGARLSALSDVYDLFPALREKASKPANSLSGGQQQMLAVGRALMSRPRMMMLDEPSLGLAPRVVEELYDKLKQLGHAGLTILLVEQDVHRALAFVDRAYVLENGAIALAGRASELVASDHIRQAYLGV